MITPRRAVNGVAYGRVAKDSQEGASVLERNPLLMHAAKTLIGIVLAGLIGVFGYLLFDLRDTARDNEQAISDVPAIKQRLRSIEGRQIEHATTLGHFGESLKRIELAVGSDE